MLPLGPPDRHRSPYKAASAFAAWPGLLASPRARGVEGRGARLPRARGLLDRGLGRVRPARRGRRPGALRPRVGGAAGVRAPSAACGSSATSRSTSRRGAPTTARTRSCSRPARVAGTPPDAYTDKGQLWGNPLYDWPAMQRRGYRWWVDRLRRTFSLFDLARIDHFRGFVSYWSVPARRQARAERLVEARAGARGVRRRRARAGPRAAADRGGPRRDHAGGRAAARRPRAPGHGRAPVRLRPRRHGRASHNPWNHVEQRVVYTGTHDHDTVRGWYESIRPERRALVDRSIDEAGVREDEPWWSLIRLAFASPARVAMVQAQDVLGLGSEARMNLPGTKGALVAVGALGAAAADLAARLRRRARPPGASVVRQTLSTTPLGSRTRSAGPRAHRLGRRRSRARPGPLRRAPRRRRRATQVDAHVRERGLHAGGPNHLRLA